MDIRNILSNAHPCILSIKCIVCKKTTDLKLRIQDYIEWRNGALIQNCFPYLNNNERELMISQMCGLCLDEAYNNESVGDQ